MTAAQAHGLNECLLMIINILEMVKQECPDISDELKDEIDLALKQSSEVAKIVRDGLPYILP